MPLFESEYETEWDPGEMVYTAKFDDGTTMHVRPHFCSSHEDPHPGVVDHRGSVDLVLSPLDPILRLPLFFVSSISLEHASAIVEGIQHAAPFALVNSQLEESE